MMFHQRNKKDVAVGTRSRGFGFIRKLEIERAMTLTVLCRELQIDFSGEAPPVAGKLSSCCISAKALFAFQLNQSCHLAPHYSLKRMHNVASVEDGYQALDRSLRATRSRRNVFPEDESGVLNGPNENVLIWIVHRGGQFSNTALLVGSSVVSIERNYPRYWTAQQTVRVIHKRGRPVRLKNYSGSIGCQALKPIKAFAVLTRRSGAVLFMRKKQYRS